MTALAIYLLAVAILPALAPAGLAAAIGRSRLGRTPGFEAGAAAVALAVTVLWSFLAELDMNALLRQLPMDLPNDDAPFERWHRIGLVALATACLAPLAVPIDRFLPGPASRRATIGALAVGCLLAAFAAFPGDTPTDRAITALTCAAAAASLAAIPRPVALASGAAAAWSTAGLAAASSFPSLAVIGGALGLATAALALDAVHAARGDAARDRRGTEPVVAVVLAALLAMLAACGHAYSDGSVPGWTWRAAVLAPCIVQSARTALRRHAP